MLFCREFKYCRIYALFVLIFWVKICACAIFYAFSKSGNRTLTGGRAKSAELLTGRSAEGLARWVADVLAELLLRQLAFSLILLETE